MTTTIHAREGVLGGVRVAALLALLAGAGCSSSSRGGTTTFTDPPADDASCGCPDGGGGGSDTGDIPEVTLLDGAGDERGDIFGDATPAPSCLNGWIDGDETDIDCGGSCHPCHDGAKCLVDADCEVVSCAGGTLTKHACTAGTCAATPEPCAKGFGCEGTACATACVEGSTKGCASGFVCSGGHCAKQSAEGFACTTSLGCEPGLFCDSTTSVCAQQKGLGVPCGADEECKVGTYCDPDGYGCRVGNPLGQACSPKGCHADGTCPFCLSGNCVNGYCCDTPADKCGGGCKACDVAGHVGRCFDVAGADACTPG